MMTRITKPFSYFGGKQYLTPLLLRLIPPHHTYCEVFGGSAALLFAKPPSPVEVYNDIDSGIANFFRVLQDPTQMTQLQHLLWLTPWSRELHAECAALWRHETDPVRKAWRFFVVAKQSFSADFHKEKPTWGHTRSVSRRGMSLSTSHYLSAIEHLPDFHARIMRVQIENDDFQKIIIRYDSPETLFYCDPPYVLETRRSGGYTYEMTLEDHQRLVDCLLQIQGRAIVSGYDHPIYQKLEQHGWQRIEIDHYCRAAERILRKSYDRQKNKRTEIIWTSFAPEKPTHLLLPTTDTSPAATNRASDDPNP